jgi:plastocyanin
MPNNTPNIPNTGTGSSASQSSGLYESSNNSASSLAPAIKTFDIREGDFYFNPNTVTVNQGDQVQLNFTNTATDYPHDFVLDGYNLKTNSIPPGGTATLAFTANTTGTFIFYCNIDGHRKQGMEGTLMVQ